MYNKVELRASTLRARAREKMKGKGKVIFGVGFVYLIFTTGIPAIFDLIFGGGKQANEFFNKVITSSDINKTLNDISQDGWSIYRDSVASSIFFLLISGALFLGLAIFALKLFRSEEVKIGTLFSGFDHFWKGLGTYILYFIYVFLNVILFYIIGIALISAGFLSPSIMTIAICFAGLFFIAAGVVAIRTALKYSLAFFVIADDFELSPRQALKKSKEMMRGNIGRFFCLNFSFIGWALLAVLVIAVAVGVITGISTLVIGYEFAIILSQIIAVIVGSLSFAIILIYIEVASAAFYQEIISDNEKTENIAIGESIEQ